MLGGARERTEVAKLDFDEFFCEEHDRLVQFCWGLTVDRDAARDLAQEAMARAWRDWSTIGTVGSNPAAWLRTVALNLVRSQWRRDTTAAGARALVAVADSSEPPPRDLDLEAALRKLPQRQREAVVLHHLLDLPVGECAAAMGVGPSTVKEHLQRGRAALATALRVDDDSEVTA